VAASKPEPSRFILVDGDQVIFRRCFGVADVTPRPGKLKASGPGTLKGKKLCVVGDEKKVAVPGCMYRTIEYVIDGTGTLTIAALAPDQQAKKTSTGGKAVLLEGTAFDAKLEVQVPAQRPDGTGKLIPDPIRAYSGKGVFKTKNPKFQGA
jgi:hypothetical protein